MKTMPIRTKLLAGLGVLPAVQAARTLVPGHETRHGKATTRHP